MNRPVIPQSAATADARDPLRHRWGSHGVAADARSDASAGCAGSAGLMSPDAMRRWLRSAVADLPGHEAEVFAMWCFAGMSCDQIASILGIERATAGTILHEARRKLQRMLPAQWVRDRKARCTRESV
jgi:DNA-directed RNA polymerase specialized sigma24 family protein